MEDISELLQRHLELWLMEREDVQGQAGLDSYVAVVSFIEFVRENYCDDNGY